MLTKTERLILSNQLQIMKALNLGDSEYYDEKLKILQRGYTHYYDQVLDMVSEDIPAQISDEVFLILNMFRALQLSYEELSETERRELSRQTAASGSSFFQPASELLEFRGFSRHHEFEHFSFASFVIDDIGDYEEFYQAEGYDSGAPMLPRYRCMLHQWALTGHPAALSREQLGLIIQPLAADPSKAVSLFAKRRGPYPVNWQQ